MMKRKASEVEAEEVHGVPPAPKKRASQTAGESKANDTRADFRADLFEPSTLKEYKQSYETSKPYPHHVISSLVDDTLLKSVREEIAASLTFTPKQTDIYRIHQTGDLANLSGLDSDSLSRLPSLLRLRNAMYSPEFRAFLSDITGAGPLSGVKTDMAINVYTPGCHLLCHDDVIGSRRVSYILYMSDPTPGKEWKPEWGGALRLYPTTDVGDSGLKTPLPDASVSLPPAFNQLSYFGVRPGESFHDVEEVYHAQPGDEHGDADRVRIAISGWYHVPQQGEEGYVPGVEESWAEKSSLTQLQGKAAEGVDFPPRDIRYYDLGDSNDSEEGVKAVPREHDGKGKDKAGASDEDEIDDDEVLNEAELTLLFKFITVTYLTPDTVASLSSVFLKISSLRVDSFLNPEFAERLKSYIEEQERDAPLQTSTANVESTSSWRVARPPHKHRYLYQQVPAHPNDKQDTTKNPLQELLEDLLPSLAFRKWLGLATSSDLKSYNVLARRFRRGMDYTLASGSASEEQHTESGEAPSPTVEVTLGITPTTGWGEDDGAGQADGRDSNKPKPNGSNGTAHQKEHEAEPAVQGAGAGENEEVDVGGYEVYMASSDPKDTNADTSDAESDLDPAVYRSSAKSKSKAKPNPDSIAKDDSEGAEAAQPAAVEDNDETKGEDEEEEDDGILFSMVPGWNRLSIVLRDAGVLRFVKYVSRRAKGDRWDITGEFAGELMEGYDDVEDDEEDGEGEKAEAEAEADPDGEGDANGENEEQEGGEE